MANPLQDEPLITLLKVKCVCCKAWQWFEPCSQHLRMDFPSRRMGFGFQKTLRDLKPPVIVTEGIHEGTTPGDHADKPLLFKRA